MSVGGENNRLLSAPSTGQWAASADSLKRRVNSNSCPQLEQRKSYLGTAHASWVGLTALLHDGAIAEL
jgi:hypothetical protein